LSSITEKRAELRATDGQSSLYPTPLSNTLFQKAWNVVTLDLSHSSRKGMPEAFSDPEILSAMSDRDFCE